MQDATFLISVIAVCSFALGVAVSSVLSVVARRRQASAVSVPKATPSEFAFVEAMCKSLVESPHKWRGEQINPVNIRCSFIDAGEDNTTSVRITLLQPEDKFAYAKIFSCFDEVKLPYGLGVRLNNAARRWYHIRKQQQQELARSRAAADLSGV